MGGLKFSSSPDVVGHATTGDCQTDQGTGLDSCPHAQGLHQHQRKGDHGHLPHIILPNEPEYSYSHSTENKASAGTNESYSI